MLNEPRNPYYYGIEEPEPIRRRHKIGRAVVEVVFGINLTPLGTPSYDMGNTPQDEIDRLIGIPRRRTVAEIRQQIEQVHEQKMLDMEQSEAEFRAAARLMLREAGAG